MASHEFRTPLATILASTETLNAYRHKLSDDQIQKRLNRIVEQVDHLKDIMEDVLLLAQLQARRAQFNPSKQDLGALCRTLLEEFQGRADVKHQLIYHAAPGDYTIQLDPKLMRQIISNLLSNAIKYSSAEKPVQITLAQHEKQCVLHVRDDGIGIPPADLPHLFEPFHRASNVRTIAGTGLGLVITKEAIELHNGLITVESQLGQGTTFTVHLPLT
jgi:signal transduction histidine kinase